jgi:hypothetical protein
MEYHIGDVVDIIDQDEITLTVKTMRGTITRFHKSKGWYWVRHATDFYSVPVRWDMILAVIKR